MTGNGGLVVGAPDFRPASHCVIPAGFSGSLMFTKRAFFTRSNNLVQTVFLCAALLKIPTHFVCSRIEPNRHSPLPTSKKIASFTPHTSITSCTNTRLNSNGKGTTLELMASTFTSSPASVVAHPGTAPSNT